AHWSRCRSMRAEPAVQRWPDWQSTAIRAPKMGARASAKLQAERGRFSKRKLNSERANFTVREFSSIQHGKATRGHARTPKASRKEKNSLVNFARSALECDESSHRFHLRCRLPVGSFRNFVHDFVTPEVIDERVACLYRMHHAFRRWRFEQRTQFHEVMAGAA